MHRAVAFMVIAVLGLVAIVAAQPAGSAYEGDPQAVAEVRAAMEKFQAASTWRSRITFASGAVQTAEYVAPNRVHMILQGGGAPIDTYSIGADAWLHDSSTCRKLPVPMPAFNPREAAARSTGTFTVAKGGPAVVDATPVQTYTMSGEQQGSRLDEKMFVAVATGLPRRIEIQTGQGSFAVDYFDYGAPIVINNPPC
jgi:hypothetical protein